MNITFIFLLGLFFAFIAVIPPGLLNMTVAKISLKEGTIRGIMFSIGACLIVIIQTYIATVFAQYLSKHPEVISILQRIALIIFIIISFYFLFMAKAESKQKLEPQIRSKHSRFFQGVFLSAINIFPIPYQAYMTITLASFGWLNFGMTNVISYVAGVAMGTFIVLYLYILFFDKIKGRSIASQKSMNYLIGTITAIISIITLFNILKDI